MTAFIAYLRVSTQKQGQSGLGLEAQQEAVAKFIRSEDTQLGTYVEVESGRDDSRPQLRAALDRCRLTGATLLIARLDRLARRVSFLSALMDSDVQFVCCDNPHANRLTLHVLSAVAEHEAVVCSQRTKAALSAARQRGTVLGGFKGRHLTAEERAQGTAMRSAKSKARALQVMPVIAELRSQGKSTLRELAQGLNALGVQAPRGGQWYAGSVRATLLQAA